MQNPSAIYRPQNIRSPSSRYLGLAFTAAINVAVIWAIIDGLTHRVSPPPPPPETQLRIVQDAIKPPVQPIMPPKPIMQTPKVVEDTVPAPKIVIQAPASQQPLTVTPTTQTQTPAPNPTIADSAASGVGGTHTTPPYPGLARRLDQQGVVTLQLSIDQGGTVTNATVRASSGYPELDQTAIDWVIAHWRYKPAVQNGADVASTTVAAVKFDLKNAR